jgi:hypothetical protein
MDGEEHEPLSTCIRDVLRELPIMPFGILPICGESVD